MCRDCVLLSTAGARYYFYAWELPIFVAMGCMGGLSGALWIRINVAMTRVRAQYVPARCVNRRLAEVIPAHPDVTCLVKLHVLLSQCTFLLLLRDGLHARTCAAGRAHLCSCT